MKWKVGFGFDVHQLTENREFFIGGIVVPHSHGALGHSDADVLIHAICDALLGALSLGDIGTHFPDNDPKYKDIDSKVLLKEVVEIIKNENYAIGNIDSTVCLEVPKLSPHIPAMKKTLASILQIPETDISIKATTNEKMGFVGRKEGVAAYAITLLHSLD
ncbi:MAG: 2-C-methyl-D-erythritol 2,4-cyclodiphosphate synthase [Bacteroidia bacterium]|nr:2-C-methyl-D-erythritol 2,4-cyclodiphosphate synthase [Bacteroidia bacterium]NNM15598.1 2-C-methyl-D-erythritol 2,4-cyclodiphosphate synthase [Bacteroidia bacterium]